MDDNSKKSCGRGHENKRKKNASTQFDRRKNDERLLQQANKENIYFWSRASIMQFYVLVIHRRSLSLYAKKNEEVWKEEGDMEVCIEFSSHWSQWEALPVYRRVDCDMLCDWSTQYPLCCKLCVSHLDQPYAQLVSHQNSNNHDHKSASNHTRYCDLTSVKKD